MNPNIVISHTPTIKLPFEESSATKVKEWFFKLIATKPISTGIDTSVSLLIENENFNEYVDETNKVILKDPSKYEDISIKYR